MVRVRWRASWKCLQIVLLGCPHRKRLSRAGSRRRTTGLLGAPLHPEQKLAHHREVAELEQD